MLHHRQQMPQVLAVVTAPPTKDWAVLRWHLQFRFGENPADSGPLIEPAEDNVYRHPTFYDIPNVVKHI